MRIAHVLACSLMAFLVASPASLAQMPPGASTSQGTGWTAAKADLTVRIDGEHHVMTVEGTEVLYPSVPSNSLTLWLNSGRYTQRAIMKFVKAEAAGASMKLNESTQDYPGTFFTVVHFPQTIAAGESVEVRFEATSLRGNGFTFTLATPVSVVEGTNGWYPQALNADGRLDADRDQPPGLTTFVMPKGERSISNGALLSHIPATAASGVETETWSLQKGAPRSFAVGPYRVESHLVGKVVVGLFSLPDTHARSVLADLTKILHVLQSEYGSFPYSRYDVAEKPNDESWVGLAARELTVEQSFVFKKPDALLFFAHEASHVWWGNLIGKRGPGIYMVNEAMAQYSAFTVLQRVRGDRIYRSALDGAARSYFQQPSLQDKPLSELDKSLQSDYNLSLSKGSWIYYMLRQRVGDAVYFSTLRSLIQSFAGKEMTLNDIRARFVARAPKRALRGFFSQWLDRKGAPIVTWSPAGTGAILLRQWQRGAPYRFDLPLAVHCGSTVFRQPAILSGKLQKIALRRKCAPSRVEVDPMHTILLWRPEYSVAPRY